MADPAPDPEAARPSGAEGPGVDETGDLLKIGDFARLAGTNLRTLRYYEELELLRPRRRSSGGFRYYRRTDLNRLEAIRSLQELGLSLERIGELLRPADTTDRAAFIGRIEEALREEDRLLQEGLERLQRQRGKVAEAMTKLSECRPCDHVPTEENNHCEPCMRTGTPLPEFLSALF